MDFQFPTSATVVHVQVGKVATHTFEDGSNLTTAIYKTSVTDPIQITRAGLLGDEHTGYDPDRAVCVQALAHYRFWSAYFRRDFPLGTFGENLIVDGFPDEDVCIGDVIRCGTALLQITHSRTPCEKPARRIGVPTFAKLVAQTERRGFLLRVLEPGVLCAGDSFQLVERPRPDAPMLYVNHLFFNRDRTVETMRWLADLEPLAQSWRDEARDYLTA